MWVVDKTYDLIVKEPSQPLLCISSSDFTYPITGKLFNYCSDCVRARMAGVPHGAFAACKVRDNQKRRNSWRQELMIDIDQQENSHHHFYQAASGPKIVELLMEQPMKYNSKMMNSIWGLYNRYSVHNFKKNTDGKGICVGEHQLKAVVSHIPFKGIYFAREQNQ